MKNENELIPIQYVIENINGIQKITNAYYLKTIDGKPNDKILIDFKIHTSLIRIETDNGTLVEETVKKFFIKEKEIKLPSYFSAYNIPIHIKDIPVDDLIENTNDLIFELIENSKIIVTIFRKDRINLKRFL